MDWQWLTTLPVATETNHIGHVRLDRPLTLKVDGRRSLGVVLCAQLGILVRGDIKFAYNITLSPIFWHAGFVQDQTVVFATTKMCIGIMGNLSDDRLIIKGELVKT